MLAEVSAKSKAAEAIGQLAQLLMGQEKQAKAAKPSLLGKFSLSRKK